MSEKVVLEVPLSGLADGLSSGQMVMRVRGTMK